MEDYDIFHLNTALFRKLRKIGRLIVVTESCIGVFMLKFNGKTRPLIQVLNGNICPFILKHSD